MHPKKPRAIQILALNNHGYAVDAQSLPKGWKELFVNANDQSNKGIYSPQHPYFSVQFHPESAPGPQDTKFLFDIFLQSIIACSQDGSFLPVTMPGGNHFENSLKTPRVLVKKVLVLGSGGLSIGQAHSNKTGNLAEIDYSIAEALDFRTILEEGYDIRLSGQDSGQGAFSQRHALLTNQVV
ncbi:class I glutamine amidotransferase-like protein [Phakopsora pachyrhizi]|nr:class I glutamine amidotransferase-like protein [Phakopsora pachyrhizi]